MLSPLCVSPVAPLLERVMTEILAVEERRDKLSMLVAGVDGVVFSQAIEAEGAVVFAHACKLGLEGIVSKRAGSLYRSGRSRQWLKSKNLAFVRT